MPRIQTVTREKLPTAQTGVRQTTGADFGAGQAIGAQGLGQEVSKQASSLSERLQAAQARKVARNDLIEQRNSEGEFKQEATRIGLDATNSGNLGREETISGVQEQLAAAQQTALNSFQGTPAARDALRASLQGIANDQSVSLIKEGRKQQQQLIAQDLEDTRQGAAEMARTDPSLIGNAFQVGFDRIDESSIALSQDQVNQAQTQHVTEVTTAAIGQLQIDAIDDPSALDNAQELLKNEIVTKHMKVPQLTALVTKVAAAKSTSIRQAGTTEKAIAEHKRIFGSDMSTEDTRILFNAKNGGTTPGQQLDLVNRARQRMGQPMLSPVEANRIFGIEPADKDARAANFVASNLQNYADGNLTLSQTVKLEDELIKRFAVTTTKDELGNIITLPNFGSPIVEAAVVAVHGSVANFMNKSRVGFQGGQENGNQSQGASLDQNIELKQLEADTNPVAKSQAASVGLNAPVVVSENSFLPDPIQSDTLWSLAGATQGIGAGINRLFNQQVFETFTEQETAFAVARTGFVIREIQSAMRASKRFVTGEQQILDDLFDLKPSLTGTKNVYLGKLLAIDTTLSEMINVQEKIMDGGTNFSPQDRRDARSRVMMLTRAQQYMGAPITVSTDGATARQQVEALPIGSAYGWINEKGNKVLRFKFTEFQGK